jgi:hypothetical protein
MPDWQYVALALLLIVALVLLLTDTAGTAGGETEQKCEC